jgi:hypothetical protein
MDYSNRLNFKGQDFFIGLDIHKKDWKVEIRNNGIQLKRFSMNPSPEELYNYMVKNYPKANYHSVYEAGFCGFWIHRRLTNLGLITHVTQDMIFVETRTSYCLIGHYEQRNAGIIFRLPDKLVFLYYSHGFIQTA